MIGFKFTLKIFLKRAKSFFKSVGKFIISLPRRVIKWIWRHRKPIIISAVSGSIVFAILFSTVYIPYKKHMPTFPRGNIFDDDFMTFYLCDWLEKPEGVVSEKINGFSYTCYTEEPLTDYFFTIINYFKNGHKNKFVIGHRGELFTYHQFFIYDDDDVAENSLYYKRKTNMESWSYTKYIFELAYTDTFISGFHFDLSGIGWQARAMWLREIYVSVCVEPLENGLYETYIGFYRMGGGRCGNTFDGNPYTKENYKDRVVIY